MESFEETHIFDKHIPSFRSSPSEHLFQWQLSRGDLRIAVFAIFLDNSLEKTVAVNLFFTMRLMIFGKLSEDFYNFFTMKQLSDCFVCIF